nr:protein LIKE COV 1-like [Ipomoea batatas]
MVKKRRGAAKVEVRKEMDGCTSLLGIGEWMIKKMPLVSYVYSASKQISGAISPDQNTNAFKEVAIIKHPRVGEYALGFITSTLMLQKSSGAEELCCVYVPTNHLYLGDIFLVNSNNIMRPNLSVREAIGKRLRSKLIVITIYMQICS